MGGTDIGADDALQMDLHGALAKAFAERIGSLDDHALVKLADAVAVDHRRSETLRDQSGLRGVRAGEADHFEGRALAQRNDAGGRARRGSGFLRHGDVLSFGSAEGSDRPLPAFPSGVLGKAGGNTGASGSGADGIERGRLAG